MLSREPITCSELEKIIKNSPIKSSSLDPLPAQLFRQVFTRMLPTFVAIINKSLSTGVMPDCLKEAMLTPILKKPQLDPEDLNNYRPISNLPYLSKLIERVVAAQLVCHFKKHSISESSQSAYRKLHSMQTALTCVANDILCALDRRELVFLVLLDLSAMFDTVDHKLLLSRLEDRVGLSGQVLDWATSYLTGRYQYVSRSGSSSEPRPLTCSVPQGSVLGTIFFTIYTRPLGDIARKFNLSFHLYADDTQLYLSFNRSDPASADLAINKLEQCIHEIKQWMLVNKLKLNGNKTEFIKIASKTNTVPSSLTSLRVDTDVVQPTISARNLGVTFDSEMSLSPHVQSLCKSANFQLHQISRIRKYLTLEATATLVHSLITSRLDYCNAVLYGLPKAQLSKLQLTMNSAARLTVRVKKSEHITPHLSSLHWLPIEQRINFKILCMTYKALHGLAPGYIKDLLKQYSPARTLRSTDRGLLCKPKMNLKSYGERAFSFAAPTLYNSIPLHIRQSTSLDSFKSNLKTYLFQLAFN